MVTLERLPLRKDKRNVPFVSRALRYLFLPSQLQPDELLLLSKLSAPHLSKTRAVDLCTL